MTMFSAHPRFTVALVALSFVLFVILVNRHSVHDGPSYPPGRNIDSTPQLLTSDHAKRPLTLKDQIAQSERWYKLKIPDRKGLIQKYGPDISKVASFNTKMQPYVLWDFFTVEPSFCRHRIQRVGRLGDGGKWVCGLELFEKKEDCVVYSIGVNGESSYEAEILARGSSCQVWGYDFSTSSMGPEIENLPYLKNRAHFQPYMLSGTDNHTAKPAQWTLREIMKANGHTWIDILKIDIEAGEFKAMEALIDAYPDASDPNSPNGLPFGQLQIEIHAQDPEARGYDIFPRFLSWWEKLEKAGLRPFWTEPNLVYVNYYRARPDLAEYSFINIKGKHELIE